MVRLAVAVAGLGIVLALLLLVTLSSTPVDQGYESAIERVLSVLHRNGVPRWFGYRWLEFSANILMFVPLGFFLSLLFPMHLLWLAVPLVPFVSAVLEATQYFLLPARFATVGDVIANTIGGWSGVVLATLTVTAVHARDRRLLRKWREQSETHFGKPSA